MTKLLKEIRFTLQAMFAGDRLSLHDYLENLEHHRAINKRQDSIARVGMTVGIGTLALLVIFLLIGA